MSDLLATGSKFLAKGAIFKAGKKVVTNGGVLGAALGAAAGVGYLAYKIFKKKNEEDLSKNYKEVKGDKKIIV
ncbi:hypothetical protein RM553_09535 [Zunongwangia sp. F363]|uniref:Uncharacterized protein n=1 Tax=Autumnicola tepida TaxID=3075595 RepID=A0ABU3C9P3_9FLAO|nr:hypothetical protein [Zunongwangia sp. F363]MDT0643068.1 hypothetical protein [Zunongwangia sp. F363]